MRESTKQRVMKAAEELHYHPNAIAQSFARRRSGNIGVVLPYVPKVHIFSTYYFSEVLSGIGEQSKESGYDMLLMFRSPGEESNYSAFFRSYKMDACLILGATDTPPERAAIRSLHEGGYPYCLVNQRFVGERFHVVEADHEAGSYDAVRALIEQGARRIAFLNGSAEYSNSADRFRGYVRAMKEAGLLEAHVEDYTQMPEGLYYEGNYSRTSGYRAATQMATYIQELDAVFASNDRMAIGLIQGLREQGYFPGHDYAIIGYDNSDAARVTDPPLSSVMVPFYEMGRLAARRVLERIGQEDDSLSDGHIDERLQTKLVVRASSATDVTR